MANFAGIPVWREVGATPKPDAPDRRQEIIVVGGGPVGLTVALDLARRGRKVTILTALDFIPAGSKAICFSRRTLEIWDRLGVADALVAKGVTWNVGKVFRGAADEPVYRFDMSPVKHQKMPGFINIQQYYVEEALTDAVQARTEVDLRWGHRVIGLTQHADHVALDVETPQGVYRIEADWVIACDGNRSPVRQMLGLDFEGRTFEDNFLIADVKIRQSWPAERLFWFDPPFNPGRSALLHQQPDDVWRLDFQLGPDIDREACLRPESIDPLVRGLLGEGAEFIHEWSSVYTFQCRRMARFVHGRVIFAGDSAHLVSPFGARGCNGGVADADNLVWKLDRVLSGDAPVSLLESYNAEAIATADENIRHSTNATDFLTPRTPAARVYRDAVLDLAQDYAFARPFVNSGRLSTPVAYPGSTLSTCDAPDAAWADGPPPGAPAIDAPLSDGWLLNQLGGDFTVLANGWPGEETPGARLVDVSSLTDTDILARRYDLQPGSAYLLRPDQYVAARWRNPDSAKLATALALAKGH